MVAHCAAGAPILVQAADAFGPNSALEPSKDATPAVDRLPFGNKLGRCCVSLPAPKNRALAKPALPVEIGYGRPDWSCPIMLKPTSFVNQRVTFLSVIFPESSTMPKLAW